MEFSLFAFTMLPSTYFYEFSLPLISSQLYANCFHYLNHACTRTGTGLGATTTSIPILQSQPFLFPLHHIMFLLCSMVINSFYSYIQYGLISTSSSNFQILSIDCLECSFSAKQSSYRFVGFYFVFRILQNRNYKLKTL